MLFTKSAPVVSRSALAKSKKFWGTSSSSNQAANSPGFFISTPQFTRHQQNQLTPYYEDTRGAGSSNASSDSHGIDNPYLALTAGANGANGAPGLYFDDDVKDDSGTTKHYRSPASTPFMHSHRLNVNALGAPSAQQDPYAEILAGDESSTDPVAEAIDQAGKITVVDGMLKKMHRLHDEGSHTAVLATFEVLETIQPALPVEAYNLVLESLVSTCDISTQLEAYEKMLTRGIRPNDTTYCIILNSLADTAEATESLRAELSPFLGRGTGILESVDEIREGLAYEEYLLLSLNILQAVVATHPKPWSRELQACLDRLVQLSIRSKLPLPESLLDVTSDDLVELIEVQPSVVTAAQQFSSLSPEQQQSQDAQLAMMQSYFKFKEPSGAIAFYSGCGSPNYLLKPLLVGFVSNGLVGTARRWMDKTGMVDPEAMNEILEAIPRDSDPKEILPSATEIFYRLTSGGNGGAGGTTSTEDAGRCAFMRLCVAAENEDALYMAIRESHLNKGSWDAITVSEVVDFLSKQEQPLLAADVCSWQVRKLVSAYEDKKLKCFVDQEIVSDLVHLFQKRDQLSLDAALRILPVVVRCSSARQAVLDLIAAAKLAAPHELTKLVTSERLSSIVSSLAAIIVSTVHNPTEEELRTLQSIFPLFVEDSLSMRTNVSANDLLNVEEALRLCKNTESLTNIWVRTHTQDNSLESLSASSPSEASLAIHRYALSPNGIDHAFRLLKDQIRLQRTVTSDAINAVIFSCVNHDAAYLLDRLYELLPKSQSNLSSLVIASCQMDRLDLSNKCHLDLLQSLEVHPSYEAYLAMVSSFKHDSAKVLCLFKEAKAAHYSIGPDMYNAVATILADHMRNSEVAEILTEMQEKRFTISTYTYESILSMYVRLGKGDRALKILKQMPITTKSLMNVKVFNDIMEYFVHKSPDRNAALEVFMDLRNTGTLAVPLTYRLLMEAYLLRDDGELPSLENADRVLSLMRRDGAPISTQCFATLLRARGVLFKDFEGARNFYRGLVKNSRVLPDQGIFQALMESYVINGKQSEVKLVLDEMRRYHVPVDEGISRLVSTSN